MTDAEAEIEARWSRWLLDRNLRGARIVLTITAFFYPFFALLDYVVAPRAALPLLYASRAFVTVVTAALLLAIRSPRVARNVTPISAVYILLVAGGIGAMIWALGGYESPYYAGLNLVMLGAGVLFVWPARVAATVHVSIVAMFVLPNLVQARGEQLAAALTSFFFLGTTATIAIAAQVFGYRAAREQVVKQLQLEEATSKLSRAHDELQRLDRFKSRFFANITHELKTPLAMVLSPIELMIAGELGPITDPQRATLRSVHRNGARLLKLIGDLLDLSRLEESRLRLNLAEHDLVAYLRQLVAQVEPLTSRKNLTVSFESDAPAAGVWCDLDRVERVFVNLLSNAAKFTPVGGHIAVRVSATATHVTACVADNGAGFPSSMAERVFERFVQVDDDASHNVYNKGGTGIGLALARELVELHGGSIWAESETGAGARFYVELPRDRAHHRADAIDTKPGRDPSPMPAEGLRPDLTADLALRDDFRLMEVAQATERRVVERDADERARGRTILVVEDTPDVVRLVHLILRQQFRIFTAPDGRRGLEMALRETPHLVITDLMMPEMDGYALTRALRADERTKHIPVVMLTARGDIDDKVQGHEAGVNAYLTKPFAARELLAVVRKQLEIQDSTTDLVLTRQMDSLEIVAGGLAHEINNPLNYIKNSLQRVRKDVDEIVGMVAEKRVDDGRIRQLETRAKTMFKTAESGVARIADTVALMGRYSREGYSRVARPHDLFAAVRDVVKLVLPATGRRVEVVEDFDGDGTVECVPEEVHQLLTNLVQNAIEASPDDGTGRVTLTGRADDDVVTLSVRDNGQGVKPDDRGRIFTPFFTTKAPGAGMGMGLTISWRVVQSLGGMLTEEGTYGEGACFVARIPRRAASGKAFPSQPPPRSSRAPESVQA